MNIKEIRELVKILDGTDVTELTLENEGSRVVIKKGASGIPHIIPQTMAPQYTMPAPAMMNPVAPSTAPAPGAPAVDDKGEGLGPNQVMIVAPMVGTFYRASSPEAPPYVQAGETIEVGQVVCIIEAMKLMNEIESEWRGKIVQILVQNAQPVEFGQPLFVLEKI